MLTFLRRKKTLRFALISTLLTGGAVCAGLIAIVASQIGEFELAAFSSKAALGLAVIIVLYVVPQLARNVQWKSDYAMHVTNTGLIFGAVILLVTILSLTSGNNLLYLVLAALLATVIVSVIAARVNLKRLTPSVRYPDHIFVGEAVPFDVTLASSKRILPSFSLSVDMVEERHSTGAEDQTASALGYFPILSARTHSRMRIERSFDGRGIFPISGFVLSTSFPFGFIEQRRFIEQRSEIVIYPQPQPLDDFSHLPPLSQGRIESRVKGSGSDLYAIRQYLNSDHHHIDWKATAKTAQLMVREFSRDDDWRVTIIFDSQVDELSAADPAFNQKFERAIVFAASLATYFAEQGAEIRLVEAENDSGFGISQAHYYEILLRLAGLSLNPPSDSAEDLMPNVGKHGNGLIRDHGLMSGLSILITPNAGQLPMTNVTAVVSFEELL